MEPSAARQIEDGCATSVAVIYVHVTRLCGGGRCVIDLCDGEQCVIESEYSRVPRLSIINSILDY